MRVLAPQAVEVCVVFCVNRVHARSARAHSPERRKQVLLGARRARPRGWLHDDRNDKNNTNTLFHGRVIYYILHKKELDLISLLYQ